MDFRRLMGLQKHPLLPADGFGAFWRRMAGATIIGHEASQWPLYVQLVRQSSVAVVITSALHGAATTLSSLLSFDDVVR
jgi:hypothetical protein